MHLPPLAKRYPPLCSFGDEDGGAAQEAQGRSPGGSPLSFPTAQSFHGHLVDGALVTWVNSSTLPSRYEAFLGAHGNPNRVDMKGIGEPWLMVAIHNPLNDRPSENPTMLRGAFKPSPVSDFINREAIEHAGGRAAPLADEEGMILRDVVRYVLSMGMYLSG